MLVGIRTSERLTSLLSVAVRRQSTACSDTCSRINHQLSEISAAGTWKHERIITSQQGASIDVTASQLPVLNLCSNNYLGLSSHPDVIEAGKAALDLYGAGLSSVRFICGTQTIHKDLEQKIAAFHGKEDAILYASCFDANAGLFEVLLSSEDAIFSDELNHASIIDGIRLCRAKKYRYKHADMADLERHLSESGESRCRLIVTDGVFSMDGRVCPLPDIVQLARRYNALVFVDDCHATGVLGNSGRGTEEYYGLSGAVDIVNSTLGKALGGAAGGYTTAKREVVELLRQRSRPYLFSNSLPPPVVACASKVFDLLSSSTDLLARLTANTLQFRERMRAAGFTISGEDHPISPVMLFDARLASQMADALLERGVYVIGFSYPVVPRDQARIRVQLSASHTTQHVDHTVDAFIAVGKQLGVI